MHWCLQEFCSGLVLNVIRYETIIAKIGLMLIHVCVEVCVNSVIKENVFLQAHKMRRLLKESELQSEEHRERLNEMMLHKEKLSMELEHLSQEYQK